jgi:tagatose-1,6-bisphosphate aldolase
MAGRALWREVVAADPAQRPAILRDVVAPRFRELSAIARANGNGWKRRFTAPPIDDGWFRSY